MSWRFLADVVVFFHFLFIIFMVVGFLFTLAAVIGVYVFGRGGIFERFFGWSIFRWCHVCGIAFVGLLTVFEKYCPLTVVENALRRRAENGGEYSGSCIIHYVEKFVYPDIAPVLLFVPTVLAAVFTVAVFFLRPPWREKPD